MTKWPKGYIIELPDTHVPELAQWDMRNLLIMPNGTIAPRTDQNLAELHRYVKRKFKKNMNDKRTKAYKYMLWHDSEFSRGND